MSRSRWPTTTTRVWEIVELALGRLGLTSMASSASGKIAFVTGGASGIGAALATKLVGKGAEVWIADRQVGPAQELAQRLNSGGGKAHAIELDVRSYPSFEQAVAEAVQQSGRIDFLFNTCRHWGRRLTIATRTLPMTGTDAVSDVNLRGVVHGIQAVYPIMIRQHSGHIVNTASMAGLITYCEPGQLRRDQACRRRDLRNIAAGGRTPRRAGLGALSGRSGPRSSPAARTDGTTASATSSLLKLSGGVAAAGARKVLRARPSCRVAWRRDHCGASVVEGIVVLRAPLTRVVDASSRKTWRSSACVKCSTPPRDLRLVTPCAPPPGCSQCAFHVTRSSSGLTVIRRSGFTYFMSGSNDLFHRNLASGRKTSGAID